MLLPRHTAKPRSPLRPFMCRIALLTANTPFQLPPRRHMVAHRITPSGAYLARAILEPLSATRGCIILWILGNTRTICYSKSGAAPENMRSHVVMAQHPFMLAFHHTTRAHETTAHSRPCSTFPLIPNTRMSQTPVCTPVSPERKDKEHMPRRLAPVARWGVLRRRRRLPPRVMGLPRPAVS